MHAFVLYYFSCLVSVLLLLMAWLVVRRCLIHVCFHCVCVRKFLFRMFFYCRTILECFILFLVWSVRTAWLWLKWPPETYMFKRRSFNFSIWQMDVRKTEKKINTLQIGFADDHFCESFTFTINSIDGLEYGSISLSLSLYSQIVSIPL